MFYCSIREEEKLEYKREGAVINTLAIQGDIEEKESNSIDLDVLDTESGVKLCLKEVDGVGNKEFCLVNRLGFYMQNVADIRVLFVGKDKMLVEVVSGAVFLRSENVPDKEPTFAISRDMEKIEAGEIDMAMLLDPARTLDTVITERVYWLDAKQLYDIAKNSKLKSFPEYCDRYTQDYYYELKITSTMKNGNTGKSSGVSIKCLGYTDLSLGKTEEYRKKLEAIEERRTELERQRREREKEMERQRALSYLRSLGEGLGADRNYDDEEGDDDFDYNW